MIRIRGGCVFDLNKAFRDAYQSRLPGGKPVTIDLNGSDCACVSGPGMQAMHSPSKVPATRCDTARQHTVHLAENAHALAWPTQRIRFLPYSAATR